MQGLVFLGDRELALRQFPDPTPGPGEVVLEIKASWMCGSDLKYYRASGGAADRRDARAPRPLGGDRDQRAPMGARPAAEVFRRARE